MSARPLVVIGDALLDRDIGGTVSRLSPDAPVPVLDQSSSVTRPGGAALAAALAAREGAAVVLIAAVGDDPAGRELLGLLGAAGVEVVALPAAGTTPEKIRLRAGHQALLRLDRGGRQRHAEELPAAAVTVIENAGAVLVSDYGGGVTTHPEVRSVLAGLRRPTVWDPHPLGAAPVPGMVLVTPNEAELRALIPGEDTGGVAAIAARARHACRAWTAESVVVTMGARGALFTTGDAAPMAVAATPAHGDPCGAGDSFASTAALRLAAGALPSEAVVDAVLASGRFVAAGGAAGVGLWAPVPAPTPDGPPRVRGATTGAAPSPPSVAADPADAAATAARVHAAGGTVVVAGGCFDVLHAGHLSLLQGARRLGDCLIVAINSDASVRRLKGAGRPVVPEQDRAAVLRSMRDVDAVAIFDEPLPNRLLGELRPHLFVKGGDYNGQELPERAVLAEWGGEIVMLPYLSGRSTTGLLREAGLPS